MSRERISGMSFDFWMGAMPVHADNVSLSISDNTAVAQTRGIPDGYVDGDVTAEGEITVDEKNFTKFSSIAAAAGSYRDMPLTDFVFWASRGGTRAKIEVFGVKLILSDLLDLDSQGGSKTTKKIKFIVTSPDFIRINGVPYLSLEDTRFLGL
ncbi:tail protein [[Actinobacillus] muris]|uniref:Tail protein n=1 Tax=Muribacter muris TaxID=67855 RepID=A0A0J5P7K8_9PAST|nr:phage protein [Muribacter muris]KMK51474.1 tail protein [[Actinobacillus] muris] [Muribacter muris]